MDFFELTQARKSIRSFDEKGIVSPEAVTKILNAARHAPSGGNSQPWHFYVIRDAEVKKQIHDTCCGQPTMLSAPVLIAVVADMERSGAKYGDRGRTLYSIQDTAAAIQNMLLCACSLGLGTCWCGAFDEAAASRILNLAEGMRPVALIPIGIPAADPAPRGRRALAEIVTYIG